MNIVKLEGTYNEIGKQHGRLIKGFFQPPPASDIKKNFTEKCIKLMEEYTPDILDEVEGLAETSEIDPMLMKSFILTLGLEPGCTVFALEGKKNSEDTPIFARNYDWDPSFLEYFIAVKTNPKKGFQNLSFSDHMVGRYGGVNEKGLAVAITAIPAYVGKPEPGIRMNIAVRWILDKMSTTKEAVEWLTNVPHQWAHNYLFADVKGTFARVESNPINTVSFIDNKFVATTNHYHDKMMKKYESTEFDFSNTHRRYDIIDKWYRENDTFSIGDIEKLLQGHDDGVCNHGEGYETIWSWYAPLGEGVAYVCHGNPCKGNFERIEY